MNIFLKNQENEDKNNIFEIFEEHKNFSFNLEKFYHDFYYLK